MQLVIKIIERIERKDNGINDFYIYIVWKYTVKIFENDFRFNN